MGLETNKNISIICVDVNTGKEIQNITEISEMHIEESVPQSNDDINKVIEQFTNKEATITVEGYSDPITFAEVFLSSSFKWYEKLWIRFWSRFEYFIRTKRWIKGRWLK